MFHRYEFDGICWDFHIQMVRSKDSWEARRESDSRAHRWHVFSDGPTVRGNTIQAVAAEYMTKLQEKHGELKVSETKIRRDITQALKELHHKADEMKGLVTKREECLMKELDESEERALARVRAALNETKRNMASTQSLIVRLRALQESGDVLHQARNIPDLQKQLKQQQGIGFCDVSLDANIKTGSSYLPPLGSVNLEDKSAKSDVGEMEPERARRTLKPDVGDYVIGLAVLGDVVCVAGHNKQYLWVQDTVRKLRRRHEIKGLAAQGMTILTNESNGVALTVVITDRNKKLHFIAVSKSSLEIIRLLAVGIHFTPCRITTDRKLGKLVVANWLQNQIVCYDRRYFMYSIQLGTGNITCAADTGDGYVALDNTVENRVHWVDEHGRRTWTYGQHDGEGMSNPCHITQDGQGRLLVVDMGNHRLHLLDAGGQLSRYLLTQDDGIRHPTCVCLDENASRLYVAHGQYPNVEVRVYKWPPGRPYNRAKYKLNVQLWNYQRPSTERGGTRAPTSRPRKGAVWPTRLLKSAKPLSRRTDG